MKPASQMVWAISGGFGFIGRNLIKLLVRNRVETVVVLDNGTTGSIEDLRLVTEVVKTGSTSEAIRRETGRVYAIEGDVRDSTACRNLAVQADVIVHLAANPSVEKSVQHPLVDFDVNARGTITLLEASREFPPTRFILASSSAPLGSVEPPIRENMAARPMSPYGASKLAGEGYCMAYSHCFGVPTVCLRFGNVYGPMSGHKTSVVARMARDACSTGALTIHGDGLQTRDFIYVEDLAEAIVKASTAPSAVGEVIQIATQSETSIRDLAEYLRIVLAEHGVVGVRLEVGAPRQGDIRRSFSDTSKARALLGWEARTTLEVGVRQTLASLLAER